MPGIPHNWRELCTQAAKKLDGKSKDFDMVTCSGISGQCVGFYVAHALDKPLLLCRKEPTKSGSYLRSPNSVKTMYSSVERVFVNIDEIYHWISELRRKRKKIINPRVLFVDDWIGSGGTRREVGQLIHAYGGNMTHEYLYKGRPGQDGPVYRQIPDEIRKMFGEVKPLNSDGYFV